MVEIVEGDLFKSDAKIICHQVNCQGVMGSGAAKQVREKYPEVYESYKTFCGTKSPKSKLLGEVYAVHITNNDKVICNLFAQENYGYDGKCYTSYEALQKCFDYVKQYSGGETIAMPYMMGCHRGGGDWNTVYKMIEDTFTDCNVILYKYNGV